MSENTKPEISIYQHSILAAKEVYQLTCKLPVQQRFVLTAQLRRTIIIVCNRVSAIANAQTKPTLKWQSAQFIKSYAELITQMKMSIRLGHFKESDLAELSNFMDQILVISESNIQAGYRN